MIFFILYMIACILVAYVGRASRLGFWGVLAASFFITPVLTFVILVLFGRKLGTE